AMSSHYDDRNSDTPLWQQQTALASLSLANEHATLDIEQYQTNTNANAQASELTLQQNTELNRLRVNGVDLGKLHYALTASGLNRVGALQLFTQVWQQLLATPSGDTS